MSESADQAALPAHVAGEFYLWLWYRSDQGPGLLEPADGAAIQYWVDDRIAFRAVGEEKVSAVMTGDNPGTTPEARAALLGGKVLRDVRLALRREEREYFVTLKGSAIEVAAAKLPGLLKAGDDTEILYERMYLYEELNYMIGALFRAFAAERTAPTWRTQMLPEIRAWAGTPGKDSDRGGDDDLA